MRDMRKLRLTATLAYLMAVVLSNSQLTCVRCQSSRGITRGRRERIVYQHPKSSNALICREHSLAVKLLRVRTGWWPSTCSVPPHPRVSIAASLITNTDLQMSAFKDHLVAIAFPGFIRCPPLQSTNGLRGYRGEAIPNRLADSLTECVVYV
jgi:hypothetical protein